MFEVSGEDIAKLTDIDLRTLVARLALAELQRVGLPRSALTAGGNQTAPDGGLDVRVSVALNNRSLDFIPRGETGFQVKKPDMSASAITLEMKPKGVLRPVFTDLAAAKGAYVIVSAQGSVADGPLQDRKKAMREALKSLPGGDQIIIDFYDRERMATWVNGYPGVLAWVQERAGRKLRGWSAIGNRDAIKLGDEIAYLSGDIACVVDERGKERDRLTLLEGIERIRQSLSSSGTCVRLVGLSGLGKTRLVEALFETGVGDEPLEAATAIYTDFADSPEPTAREMARDLLGRGSRAILVVDNCNPATHGALAKLCGGAGSQVSLLTVEYDVGEDEPEQTEVFRLESPSTEIVAKWLEHQFSSISQIDRERIAEFSDGNFRVAKALAETLRKGEALGQLKNRDLFARIFDQRAAPDLDLMAAAEDLALLYSFNGEDVEAGGELAILATLRDVPPSQLFRATIELKRRGVVQSRGRWRAILPHAIANRLAALGLERIPTSHFDAFSALPFRCL